jgi:nucleotide-binding universal stress UspA family protein
MTELSQVLCAVDFSEPAQVAFTRALALCAEQGAHLTVVQAVPLDQRYRAHGRDRMNAGSRLQRMAEGKGVKLRVRVQQGEPAEIILLHANAKPFDLLVIGSHRRTGWERFRLGSVAERVVQRAACPVLIVAAPDQDKRRSMSGTVSSILCPMDFTRASTAAVANAYSIAKETGGRLTLLHVLQALSSSSTSRFARDFVTPENRQRLAERAHQRMEAALPPDVRASRAVQTRVAMGKPLDAIVRAATAVEANLVIMGVTSRGALGRRFIGSTAARVIGRTGCAVLAVPELTRTRSRRSTAVRTPAGAA